MSEHQIAYNTASICTAQGMRKLIEELGDDSDAMVAKVVTGALSGVLHFMAENGWDDPSVAALFEAAQSEIWPKVRTGTLQ